MNAFELNDPKVFEALATVAGGEKLPPGWNDESPSTEPPQLPDRKQSM
jgi:hypothetical protein